MINPFRKQSDSSQADLEKRVDKMYLLYKKAFIYYYWKDNDIDKETLEEIYNDSFYILWKAIRNGKIKKTGDSSLKSFLFKTGWYKLLKHLEQENKKPDITTVEKYPPFMDTDDSDEWMEKQNIVREVVNQMDELCKNILSLHYWQDKKMDEIAKIRNYKNGDVVKSKNYKCKSLLEKRLKEIFRIKGLM